VEEPRNSNPARTPPVRPPATALRTPAHRPPHSARPTGATANHPGHPARPAFYAIPTISDSPPTAKVWFPTFRFRPSLYFSIFLSLTLWICGSLRVSVGFLLKFRFDWLVEEDLSYLTEWLSINLIFLPLFRFDFSSPVSSPPILHSLAPQLSGSEGHLIKSFGIHFDNYWATRLDVPLKEKRN
jgi:hypothetical protein